MTDNLRNASELQHPPFVPPPRIRLQKVVDGEPFVPPPRIRQQNVVDGEPFVPPLAPRIRQQKVVDGELGHGGSSKLLLVLALLC
jgi:hypothetical protein